VSLASVGAAMAGAAREEKSAGAIVPEGEGEEAMAQPGPMSPSDTTEKGKLLAAKEEQPAVMRLCCVREQEAEEAMGTVVISEELEAEAEG
jgi:hypothetical protein